MLLLDSLHQLVDERLQTSLQDIVNNIHIESNFCIRHPNYKPLQLPTEAVERFERLPYSLQMKYLNLQLQNFLYGIYYNGFLQAALAPTEDSKTPQHHENNTFLGVDLVFYERLHDSNNGEGYFDSGWLVVRQEDDSFVVAKGGLTLWVGDRHLQPEVVPLVGEEIAIRLPRNRVQNGFYMAVGDAGPPSDEEQLTRIYFNLSPEGAVAVMDSLTRQLNKIALPFLFKVLYDPAYYKRHDSGVLYFAKSHYAAIRKVLQQVYAEHQAHFRTQVPLFTKFLAPGLAIAEEPDLKFAEQESFGMNRCQIVASGLLLARENNDESPQKRMVAILQQFSSLELDLNRSYLNANSEDIYIPLQL